MPKTVDVRYSLGDVLDREIALGSCVGGVVTVLSGGSLAASVARGESLQGRSMEPATPVLWFSMSKLLSTLVVARAWAAGAIDPQAPAAAYVEEFGAEGKSAIRLVDLWNHSAPLRGVDRTVSTSMTRREAVALICASRPDARHDGSYLGHAGFLVLAEAVERAVGVSWDEYAAEEVCKPLGLASGFGRVAADQLDAVPHLMGQGPTRVPFRLDASFASNGASGPVGDAAVVVDEISTGRSGLVRESVLKAIRTPVRPDSRFGLGVEVRDDRIPPEASSASLCHGGYLTSFAWCDPTRSLAVAMFFNGAVPEAEHRRRCREVGRVAMSLV